MPNLDLLIKPLKKVLAAFEELPAESSPTIAGSVGGELEAHLSVCDVLSTRSSNW